MDSLSSFSNHPRRFLGNSSSGYYAVTMYRALKIDYERSERIFFHLYSDYLCPYNLITLLGD